MTGHHGYSLLAVAMTAGESQPKVASLRNHAPAPNIQGRSDIPEWTVPEQFDKGIHRVVMYCAADPGTASEVPQIRLDDSREGLEPTGTPGQASFTSGNLEPSRQLEWWPDVQGTPMVTDRAVFDLQENPIAWEYDDLIHMCADWQSEDHAGITARAYLYWHRA